MYKISIIIPTCNRGPMLYNCLDSIDKFTANKASIEVLLIADNTDNLSQQYSKDLIGKFSSLDIKLLVRDRSEMLNRDYYNWAADQATGDLMWVFADDLIIVAPNWDEVIQTQVAAFAVKHPDMIFCVSIKDNTPTPSHRLPKFPCFPMLTRQAKVALGGWILHPKVPTWGADYVTYCIFHPIYRLLEVNDRNYINHISFHNKQVEVDATNHRIGDIFNRLKMIPEHNTDRILSEEVPNIRNVILDRIHEAMAANPELYGIKIKSEETV